MQSIAWIEKRLEDGRENIRKMDAITIEKVDGKVSGKQSPMRVETRSLHRFRAGFRSGNFYYMKRLRGPSFSELRPVRIVYGDSWHAAIVLGIAIFCLTVGCLSLYRASTSRAPVYGTVCYGGPCR